jgi:RHS repeat-associated protein
MTVGYSVDNDSRITGLTYSAGTSQLGNLTYGYDADGRVTSKNGTLAAISLPNAVSGNTFNADNGMTGFNGTTLSYDANGNLTNDGTNTYTWDARNYLTAISGGATVSFVYDAFGRRMSKTVGGGSTQFLYDQWNPVQELQNGSPSANLLTGLRIDEYFTRTDSSGAMNLLSDALGSTIGLTNSAGSLVTNYTYEPFGATTIGGAANGNAYQFTGRENDGTPLYFYRARYYSPMFRRFISQDPIGFRGGDANLYGYVLQDPVSYFDPFGLDSYTVGGYAPVVGPFGPGFQVTVGTNPDGTQFVNFKVGVGSGAGASYDPNGTSPGYSAICGKKGALLNLGVYGEANANIPGFSFSTGGEAGVNIGDPVGPIPYSEGGNQMSVSVDPNDPFGVSGDVGVGVQVGVHM